MPRQRALPLVAVLALALGTATPGAATPPTAISACPFTITAPGPYGVTGDLSSTGTCLTVLTDFVDINLNTHTLTGNGTGSGIIAPGSRKAIVVHNGTITNFDPGISLAHTREALVEEMAVNSNGGDGVTLGDDSSVSDSVVDSNGGFGVRVGRRSLVANSDASSNTGGSGITAGRGSGVVGNGANNNSAFGIAVTCPAIVTGNTTSGNTSGGVSESGVGCVDDL